jgi:hypothetical protein
VAARTRGSRQRGQIRCWQWGLSQLDRSSPNCPYFIELTFPSGGLYPFKFTTGVRVVPDVLPFGPPPEMVSSGRESHVGRNR